LQSGDEVKDLVLRVQPAGVIIGKALDRDGDPIPWVIVTATPYPARFAQSNHPRFASANDQGEYRIAPLPSGRYLISALSTRDNSDETDRPEPKDKTDDKTKQSRSYTTYYPGTSDRNQAVPVEISAGDEIPVNINMVFGPAFRVRGTVANLVDAAHADDQVFLVAKDATGLQETYEPPEIKDNGSFEIRGVPPGFYYLVLKSSTANGPRTTSAESVEVKDSDIENLRITAVPASSIHGRLRLEDSQKPDLTGFSVFLESDETGSAVWSRFLLNSLSAGVNRDGSFEIQHVPAGNYQVSAWWGGASRDLFVRSVHLGGTDVTNSGFNASGGNYTLEIVIGTQGAAIEGNVLDGKDQPVAGATVVAIPDAARRQRPDSYLSDTADQQGRFKLHGLVPGEYAVIALEDPEEDYRDPEFLKKSESSSQAVRMEKGEHRAVSLKVFTEPTN
jgi:hypothetical protein